MYSSALGNIKREGDKREERNGEINSEREDTVKERQEEDGLLKKRQEERDSEGEKRDRFLVRVRVYFPPDAVHCRGPGLPACLTLYHPPPFNLFISQLF